MASLYTAVNGLEASQMQLDVAANNLANVNTAGFKSNSVIQSSSSVEALSTPSSGQPLGIEVGQGVQISGVSTDDSQGDQVYTGYPSDLSISGVGFFEVVSPNGDTYFTRVGDFVIDAEGFVRTIEGGFLSAGGAAIQVPKSAMGYSVSPNGMVTVTLPNGPAMVLGQIDLATFNNENGLIDTGGGLLKPTEASGPPTYSVPGTNGAGTIQQGTLEASNVDVANQMVNEITAVNSFEANAKVFQVSNDDTKILLSLIS